MPGPRSRTGNNGMKVLLRIRSDVEQFPGGDHVHLLKIKRGLEQLGIECAVSPGLTPIPADVDVVHLFNLTRIHETYLQFQEARERGIPVALTPIWHSMLEMRRFYARLYKLPLFPIWTYQAAKELHYARRSRQSLFWPAALSYRRLQREVVAGADVVLPNSRAELDILQRELGVQAGRTVIVPPAFDKIPSPEIAAGSRRDVLCVGRIEPRKNQLAVIRAFKSLGRTGDRLLIYGSLNHSHPKYARDFQAELAAGWVEHRGHVPLEELSRAYSKARGVVLASYFETCGFAVMEALAGGAHACVSDTPYTRDFYGGHAVYCDPFSETSIRDAIATMLAKPETNYDELLSQYSWERAADTTRLAYGYLTENRTWTPATA